MNHDHEPEPGSEQGSEVHPAGGPDQWDLTAESWPWGPGEQQAARPSPKPGWTKKAGLGAAALVLVGGAFGVVWAVTSGSNGSSSATPASASQSASSGGPDSPGSGQVAAGPDQGGAGGFALRGPGHGAGLNGPNNGHTPTPAMAGTVTNVNGSTIKIKDFMGFTRTIHTSSSTTYTRGGQPASSSAVTNGANIAAQGTVDKDGTDLDANKVNVVLPRVAGTVQSVSGSSFVVQGPDGATHKVTTTGSTTFRQGRNQTASLSDVKQGVRVVASGDRQSNGDLTATTVQIVPARMQHPSNSAGPGPGGAGGPQGNPPSSTT